MVYRSPTRVSLLAAALIAASCGGGEGTSATGSSVGTILNSPVPVSGATVTLTGPGGSYTVKSSTDGGFRVDGIPAGTYQVEVNGTGVFDENGDPIADKIDIVYPSVVIGSGDNVLGGRPVFLPEKAAGTAIDTSGGASAVIPAGTVIENEAAGVSLIFESAATVTFPDSQDTTLAVTVLPAEQIPFPLPGSVSSAQVAVVTPLGASFSTPVKVSFANWNDVLASSSGVELFAYDESEGTWGAFGTGRVSSDGNFIVSDSGVGASSTGWLTPVVNTFCSTTVTGNVQDSGGDGIPGALVTTLNGATATTDLNGDFTIEDVPLAASGSSVVATVLPAENSGFEANDSAAVLGACGAATDVGAIVLTAQVIDVTEPTVVSTTPAADAVDVDDNTVVSILFSEEMSPGTLLDDAVQLRVAGQSVDGDVALSNSGGQTTAIFVPEALLPVDATLELLVDASVADASGNLLGADMVVSFRTAAATSGGTASMDVTPDGTTVLDPGDTQTFAAAFTDASGSLATGALVEWSSDAPNIASVDSTGLVTAISPGSANISASFGNATDTEIVSVSTPAIASVAVNPDTLEVATGAVVSLDVDALDSGDDALEGFDFAWTTSDASVASVDAQGNVSALSAGTATITATEPNSTFSDSATITVTDLTAITEIAIDFVEFAVGAGSAIQLTATANDVGGDAVPGVGFTWTSSDTDVATVSNSGVVAGLSEGVVSITAEAQGVQGVSAESIAQVFLDEAVVATVLARSPAATPLAGITVVRHDPETGDYMDERITDAAGMADFGMIGAPRTSLTAVFGDFKGSASAQLISLIDVPVGGHAITRGTSDEVVAVDIDVSGIGGNDNTVQAFTSGFQPGETFDGFLGKGSAFVGPVLVDQLQADGNFSLIVTVGDAFLAEPSAAAFLLDVDPETVGQSLLLATVDAGSLSSAAFTYPGVVVPAGGLVRRSGVIFDLDFGEAPESEGGTVSLPIPTGADRVAYRFESSLQGDPTVLGRSLSFTSVPQSLAPSLPDLTITTVVRDGSSQSTSLSTAGTDAGALDLGRLSQSYQDTNENAVEWELRFDPSLSSVDLPSLPGNLSFLAPPLEGVSYETEFFEVEGVSGFDALLALMEPFQGELDQLALDAQLDVGSARRTIHPLLVSVAGAGSVTVTIDTGSGAVTLDPAVEVDLDAGTTITLNFSTTDGSVISAIGSPDASPTGLNTSSASCTFELTGAESVSATTQGPF